MTASDSTGASIRSEIFRISTEVEESGHLMNSYMHLLFDANQFQVHDAEQVSRHCSQMYALLVAARAQVERLQGLPEALMVLARALEESAGRTEGKPALAIAGQGVSK